MTDMNQVEDNNDLDAELAMLFDDEIVEEKVPEEADAELSEVMELESVSQPEEPVAATEEASSEVVESAVSDLEAAESRAELYEAQVSTEKEPKAKPEKKAKSEKKASGRIVMSGYAQTSEALKAMFGDKINEYMVFDSDDDADNLEELAATRLAEIDNLAVKERAKVANIFKHLAYGSRLEGYVAQAINLLIDTGEISAKSMREKLLAHPYSTGTANAQTNQMMHILPALKIVIKEEGVFKVNPNSTIYGALKAA